MSGRSSNEILLSSSFGLFNSSSPVPVDGVIFHFGSNVISLSATSIVPDAGLEASTSLPSAFLYLYLMPLYVASMIFPFKLISFTLFLKINFSKEYQMNDAIEIAFAPKAISFWTIFLKAWEGG